MGKFISLFCLVSLSSPTLVEAKGHVTKGYFQARQAKKQRARRRLPTGHEPTAPVCCWPVSCWADRCR